MGGKMPSKPAGRSAASEAPAKDGKKGKVQQKEDDGEFLIIPSMQHNAKTLGNARVFSSVIAGCVAGLLKCEGFSGVFVFIVVTLIHSTMIMVKMGFNVTRHFPRGHDIFVSQFSSGLMSYILFWTL